MNTQLDNSNISKHLGKITGYKATYDPTLLVREPRQNNRKHLGIKDDALPFTGYDIWNAYEVSCLTEFGMPTACIAKIYILVQANILLNLNLLNSI